VVADARQVIANPTIDIVVELIGGYGIAKALVLEAIAAGKHVVTANKALLAVHGSEIFAAARAKGVIVAFEAAVAGGIPIIKALREGLTANRIEWVAGIINGTTNFILSEMRAKGLDFGVVLKQAQRLGYAEADPTFDIEGVDAAHKATIMSAIAFGIPVQFDKATSKASPRCRRPTSAMPSSWATASSCWASPSATRGGARWHRAARAPHAGPLDAPDRQRRRRDERRGGAGRRRRHHAVLRQGRRQRAHRQRRGRRPGGHHPAAHRRPRPPRAAPGLPARHAGRTRRSCRSTRWSRPSTCAWWWPTRPACWRASPASWPSNDISIDAVLQRESAEGEKQTDLIILTHDTVEGRMTAGAGADAGAAHGAGADREHPQGRAELKYISTRGDRTAARLLRHPARRPGARRRAVPADALPAGRRGHAGPLARPAYADLAFEILSLYIDDIPAADLQRLCARPTPKRCSARRRSRR
jgi:hypothetical protein